MKLLRTYGFMLGLLAIAFYSNAQDNHRALYDSILSLDISTAEMSVALESFLTSERVSHSSESAALWYEYAKWNYRQKRKLEAVRAARTAHVHLTDSADPDIELLKKNLYNLGFFHKKLDYPDYPNALFYLDTLIAISDPLNPRVGKAYKEKGDVYDALGDFQRALDNYGQAARIHTGNDDPGRLIITYLNTSGTYANLRDGSYADSFFDMQQKVDELLEDVSLSDGQEMRRYSNMGVVYETIDDFDAALSYYERLLAIAERIEDSTAVYRVLNNMGVLMKRKGDNDGAWEYHMQSMPFSEGNRTHRSTLFSNLAEVLVQRKEFGEARKQYDKAIAVQLYGLRAPEIDLISKKDIENSPFKRDVLEILIDKLGALLKEHAENKDGGALEEASRTMELADAVVDMLYFESREELSKLFWRKKSSELYVKAVQICHEQGDPARAFYYMEKNKGLLLLENITAAKARQYARIPEAISDREYELQRRIQDLEGRLGSTDPEGMSNVQDALFREKTAYKNFIDSLETSYPAYFNFKQGLQVVSLEEVRKTMDKNEVILQYLLGASDGFVLKITSEESRLTKFETGDTFTQSVTDFRDHISKPFVSEADISEYKGLAWKLYSQLIPFTDSNAETLNNKRLIVVPDGALQSLPFEVLTTRSQATLPDDYLIYQTPVHYKYSLSAEMSSVGLQSNPKKGFSAFILSGFQDNYLPGLVHSTTEETQLKPYFSEAITLTEATKKRFLQSYNDYNVVHISSHGGVTKGTPWLGFYDEQLELDELYFLRNAKELVVLSACQTSLGEHKQGEGVFNLTRGFLNSGTRSVLSTLWDLNETTGLEITSGFYEGITKGENKSDALQGAKLAYLEKHANTSLSSPYYWSSIVLTGDDAPIRSRRTWPLMLAGFITVCFVGYRFFTKR